MNKDVADKWVKALRSGEYKQGYRKLKTSDGGYCCLGVLQGPVLGHSIEVDVDAGLSVEAQKESGLFSQLGDTITGLGKALYRLNDVEGYTFLDIADYIEKNYQYL